MERYLKKQIDDLLEYAASLKIMFLKLAIYDAYPEELNENELHEIECIINAIECAIKIENNKINKMSIHSSDIDAIKGYLLSAYKYTRYYDFLYEDNNTERLRIYNKILNKHIIDKILDGTCSFEEKAVNVVTKAIESNQVYALDKYMNEDEDRYTYSFLKYGRIFISPSYDTDYFPKFKVAKPVRVTSFRALSKGINNKDLKKYALSYISNHFRKTADNLYDGFTNEALKREENEISALGLTMLMIGSLITSFDTRFLDERYVEYLFMRRKEPEYSHANKMILYSIRESKKIVLSQKQKRN